MADLTIQNISTKMFTLPQFGFMNINESSLPYKILTSKQGAAELKHQYVSEKVIEIS